MTEFIIIGKMDGDQVVILDEPEYVNFPMPGDVYEEVDGRRVVCSQENEVES